MMTFTELKKRFKNKDMFPLKPWNNVTNTPEGKPVGGDCEDWGWSSWVAVAGGVKNALIEMVTLKGIMWRCRSKHNYWFWPRHAVLQRNGKFTDSNSKDWRDDIGENTRYYPAGMVLALIVAFTGVSIFRPEWIVNLLFVLGVL